MQVIFLGPPGVGKGTIATLICEKFSIAHISTGDLLRAELKAQTPLGIEAQGYMTAGKLVPDEVVIGRGQNRIKADDCKNGFLFDGFPRTLEQAEALEGKVKIDLAVNFTAPDEVLIGRATSRGVCADCGKVYSTSQLKGDTCQDCSGKLIQREDDTEATVKNRLEIYRKLTLPLEDYYKNKGLLEEVDADRPVEKVFEDAKSSLGKLV